MKQLLLNIIKRQKRELKELIALATVKREKTAQLQDLLSSPLIKVILGPRRAGKSTIVLQALENKKFAYLNFEDESLPQIEDGDILLQALDEVYGEIDFYFFDEIQNFNKWQKFLNRLHRLGKNIIVSGSNAQLLSEEFASALTGRHASLEILPFSYREILSDYDEQYSFKEYLKKGGFPEVVLKKTSFETYLSTLWDSVILKDIAKRKKVRNISALSNVLSLLLANVTSQYNVDGLREALNSEVSSPTIKKFIEHGEEAYLLKKLMLYSVKPKNRIKTNRKIYTIDNGFLNAKNISHSENFGLLLENAVFNELRNRGNSPNHELFYYTTRSGYEVDFILREGHQNKEAIQVCYSLKGLKTRERELRSLVEVAEELKINKLTVVNLDEESNEKFKDKNIEIISAKTWFLDN